MPHEPTEYLLERLHKHDRSALRELFHRYYLTVCRAILGLVKDEALTEDLAQNVFLRLWEKREGLQVNSSFGAYLRRMAINEALAHFRKAKRRNQENFSEHPPASYVGRSVEQDYLLTEMQERILTAIESLPPRCRLVFRLSRFEELSYREIAERLDISVKTVENQMGKALKILRERLQEEQED
ncbi:MAG: RNA polymerase sigma-70 factor [Bacteroidetes bacterium]|nr:MAG: RNA polymerase sigma-70 factor [Bacteroidota bacterium]